MERIYTIPINEAFDTALSSDTCGCPLCLLEKTQTDRETELILGASMMEPDIRIKTNRLGFCLEHFRIMQSKRNRLGIALILQSHLRHVASDVTKSGTGHSVRAADATAAYLGRLEKSCYICERVQGVLEKMIATVSLLWEEDRDFRRKFSAQPRFCLRHYRLLLEDAKKRMNKKLFAEFYEDIQKIETAYLEKLCGDIDHFCRKFDYRFAEEPWYDSKDAIERAVDFLSADEGKTGAK